MPIIIYALLNKETNEVKIGSTQNLKQRRNDLNNSEQTKLILLGYIFDNPSKEYEIQADLESFQTRRRDRYMKAEWFDYSSEFVRDYINSKFNN